MNSPNPSRTTGQLARLLRQQGWIIALCAVIFGGIGFAYSASQEKEYEATSSVQIQDTSQSLQFIGALGSTPLTPAQIAAQHARIVSRAEVAQRVKTSTGTTLTVAQLQSAVTAVVDATSNLVNITVTAATAPEAARLADAFATEDAAATNQDARANIAQRVASLDERLRQTPKTKSNKAQRTQLQAVASQLRSLIAIAQPEQVISQASVPGSPSQPKTARNVVVLLIVGLLIGVALADLRRSRDRRIRDVDDVLDHLPFPVLGHVSNEALGHGVNHAALSAADVEAFRIVRQGIQFLDEHRPLKTILVSSSTAQEGKSSLASAVAAASASAGEQTLLVECDLRRPVLAERLGLAGEPGLVDYLEGRVGPQDILQVVPANPLVAHRVGAEPAEETANLVCITAGSKPTNPAELLASPRFAEFIASVSEVYDAVIIDAPPLLSVVDTLELVPRVEALVLCARIHQTTREHLTATAAALGRMPTLPTGLVITGLNTREDAYYSYTREYVD